jgi:CBS domain-containing protein
MTAVKLHNGKRLVLAAKTAADLMTSNPISISAEATVREALGLMIDRGFSIAPVIDEAGRPVGVLSRTDILVHDREQTQHAQLLDETGWDTPPRRLREGFSVEVADPTTVRDIMTPVIFTVQLETPVADVVAQMLELRVHHLFVVDEDCALVGVISSLDVLRRLQEV